MGTILEKVGHHTSKGLDSGSKFTEVPAFYCLMSDDIMPRDRVHCCPRISGVLDRREVPWFC